MGSLPLCELLEGLKEGFTVWPLTGHGEQCSRATVKTDPGCEWLGVTCIGGSPWDRGTAHRISSMFACSSSSCKQPHVALAPVATSQKG